MVKLKKTLLPRPLPSPKIRSPPTSRRKHPQNPEQSGQHIRQSFSLSCQLLFYNLLRTSVYIRSYQLSEGCSDVVYLQYQISGLQRSSGMVGQVLAKFGEPSKNCQAYGQVFWQVWQRQVRHGYDQHLTGGNQVKRLGDELFFRSLIWKNYGF